VNCAVSDGLSGPSMSTNNFNILDIYPRILKVSWKIQIILI